MKTLVNKINPQIIISAPEIEEYINNYFISCNDTAGRNFILQKSDWTLVEEESVDLDKEIDACWRNWLSPSNRNEVEEVLPKTEFAMHARHFYELGLNARKEVRYEYRRT